MRYKKNILRRDIINRYGEETGLPLFANVGQESLPVGRESLPVHVKARLESAPKAIALATDTRKLGEMTAKIDEMKLADKQQEVLDTMYYRDDWSYQELALKLGWSVNRVIPRVTELREMGLVIPYIKRPCEITGMIVQTWRVK
jgi:DNA-directed RNA polymerase specialized sigma24 family protein